MLVLFLFFFFKQKTAYEMRISDWSSDVCSSDLHTRMTIRKTHRVLHMVPCFQERLDQDPIVARRRAAALGSCAQQTASAMFRPQTPPFSRFLEERPELASPI